jgi:hypothetical protein
MKTLVLAVTVVLASMAAKPLFRDPIYDGAADPSLVYNNGKWFMFYTNRRATETKLTGVSWVHGTKIGIAESTDGGKTWKYAGTAAIPYGNPDYTFWAPEIFENDRTFHMYLSVVPGIFNDWNADREIIHLTSADLHTWKFESKLDLGSDRVIDPCVIRLPNHQGFRLWYKDERSREGAIRYADSPDLYHWKSRGVALPRQRGEGPKAFRWKGHFWLIVDVWDGLGVFSSDDCLHWTRQPGNILKEPGTQPTDQSKGGHADVIVNRDRAFLFYFVHQDNKDAEGKPPEWKRRTVIQALELKFNDGRIEADRNAPIDINLGDTGERAPLPNIKNRPGK